MGRSGRGKEIAIVHHLTQHVNGLCNSLDQAVSPPDHTCANDRIQCEKVNMFNRRIQKHNIDMMVAQC